MGNEVVHGTEGSNYQFLSNFYFLKASTKSKAIRGRWNASTGAGFQPIAFRIIRWPFLFMRDLVLVYSQVVPEYSQTSVPVYAWITRSIHSLIHRSWKCGRNDCGVPVYS